MTIFLILTLTAALALTLRATFRLIAQRDAERRRGDLARAEADSQFLRAGKAERELDRRSAEHYRREAMLLDDLDFACSEAVALRERLEAVQARELPQLDEIRAARDLAARAKRAATATPAQRDGRLS